MKKLSKQELHDILLGASIISTGGGGTLEDGIEIVDKALEDGMEFNLVNDSEFELDSYVGTPYGCGSISPFTKEQQEAYDKMEKIEETNVVLAVKAFEETMGINIDGIIATELGGHNTASALEAAARLGKPIIDADPAGRSVPCLEQTTYFLKDISIAPMGVASVFGDTVVIPHVANDTRAEELTRSLAVASFNNVGVVDHVNTWKVIREAIHLNTITWCLEIGQAAREEIEKGNDYASRIVNDFDGYHIFEGIVTKSFYEDKDGFTIGETHIKGINDYENDELVIWYQNENLISTLNGKPYVLTPDLINVVDCKTFMPVLNPFAKEESHVKVFGHRARSEWRSEKGLSILSPKFFNFDYEYTPIEEVLKK